MVGKNDLWMYVYLCGKVRYSDFKKKFVPKLRSNQTFHKYKVQLEKAGRIAKEGKRPKTWYYVPKNQRRAVERLVRREALLESWRPYYPGFIHEMESNPKTMEITDSYPEPFKSELKEVHEFLKSSIFVEILRQPTSILAAIRDVINNVLAVEDFERQKITSPEHFEMIEVSDPVTGKHICKISFRKNSKMEN